MLAHTPGMIDLMRQSPGEGRLDELTLSDQPPVPVISSTRELSPSPQLRGRGLDAGNFGMPRDFPPAPGELWASRILEGKNDGIQHIFHKSLCDYLNVITEEMTLI